MSCQSCELGIGRKYRTCECLELDLPFIEYLSVSIMRLCNQSLAMAIPIVSETNCYINEHFTSTCISHLAYSVIAIITFTFTSHTRGSVWSIWGKHPELSVVEASKANYQPSAHSSVVVLVTAYGKLSSHAKCFFQCQTILRCLFGLIPNP